MIKQTWLKWVVILVTGAAVYGLTYGASQYAVWSQVFSMLNTVCVLTCGILTGFPKES
jgi:Ni,Fe-hydrogenase I cytochrome b subunit